MMGGIDMTDVPVDGCSLPRLNAIDYTITFRNTTTPYPYDRELICPYQPTLPVQTQSPDCNPAYSKQTSNITFRIY